MGYPTNYQDAEHRRALNAILGDLHAIDDAQCTDEACASTNSKDGADAEESAGRETVIQTDAEVQVRTTRLSGTQMATHSAN
ncbi:MAG: hypothetical protein ACF8LK_07950 [Phycisphaerales bacterium JB041]